jgi:hypothetical protein
MQSSWTCTARLMPGSVTPRYGATNNLRPPLESTTVQLPDMITKKWRVLWIFPVHTEPAGRKSERA